MAGRGSAGQGCPAQSAQPAALPDRKPCVHLQGKSSGLLCAVKSLNGLGFCVFFIYGFSFNGYFSIPGGSPDPPRITDHKEYFIIYALPGKSIGPHLCGHRSMSHCSPHLTQEAVAVQRCSVLQRPPPPGTGRDVFLLCPSGQAV